MKSNIGLVKHAEKALKEGWYYLWGAYGQKATHALLDANIKQYPENEKWRKYAGGAIGKTRFCDCYGLVKSYLWWTDDNNNPKYNAAQDKNTKGAYDAAKEKGLLASMPDIPGIILYMTGHTGVYCGNDSFVDLRGEGAGAAVGRVSNGKIIKGPKFTHWFKDANIDYGMTSIISPPVNPTDVAAIIRKYFKDNGLNDYAVAGVMGNLYAESGFIAANLQNSFEAKLGFNDKSYTAAVDSGAYKNFVKDGAGYGLAQWTHSTLKQGLLDFAKARDKSVGDLNVQLDFLRLDMKRLLPRLNDALSVKEASDIFMLEYEKPADKSEAAKLKRAALGQGYYNQFKGVVTPPFKAYTVKVIADSLNIREGAGTNHAIVGAIKDKGTYIIVDVSDGVGALSWGKLKSGAGWIALDYTITEQTIAAV